MTKCKLITAVERRMRWSLDKKRQIIEETYLPGYSVSQVARKYGIIPSQLFYWRRLKEEGALREAVKRSGFPWPNRKSGLLIRLRF